MCVGWRGEQCPTGPASWRSDMKRIQTARATMPASPQGLTLVHFELKLSLFLHEIKPTRSLTPPK